MATGTLSTALGSIDLGQPSGPSTGTRRVSSKEFVALEWPGPKLQPEPDSSEVSADKSFVSSPRGTPTIVRDFSASPSAIRQIRSAAAVGVQRRRQVSEIAKHLRRLPDHAGRQDFHSVAFPVFDMVRRTYQDLVRFDQYEGNTCMILRYVRNSLIDGGWNRYKEKAVAAAVADLLDRISKLETISRQDAKDTFRLLYELKLRATLPVVIEPGDTEHED